MVYKVVRRDTALIAAYLFIEKVLPFVSACALYVSLSLWNDKGAFLLAVVGILGLSIALYLPVILLSGKVLVLGARMANSRPLESAWLTLTLCRSTAASGKELQAGQIIRQILARAADYGTINALTSWQTTLLVLSLIRCRKPIQSRGQDLTENWLLAMEMISKFGKTPKILRPFVSSRALRSS